MMPVAVLLLACCGHGTPIQALAKGQAYVIDADARGVGSALATGGSGYDCDDELNRCFKKCWESSRQPYPHMTHDEWYYEYCTRECRKEYMECVKELEKEEAERAKKKRPLEFTSIEAARAWIRSHKSQISLGTVVVVAGAAFVLATGGSGALILAPLAL